MSHAKYIHTRVMLSTSMYVPDRISRLAVVHTHTYMTPMPSSLPLSHPDPVVHPDLELADDLKLTDPIPISPCVAAHASRAESGLR